MYVIWQVICCLSDSLFMLSVFNLLLLLLSIIYQTQSPVYLHVVILSQFYTLLYSLSNLSVAIVTLFYLSNAVPCLSTWCYSIYHSSTLYSTVYLTYLLLLLLSVIYQTQSPVYLHSVILSQFYTLLYSISNLSIYWRHLFTPAICQSLLFS